MDSMRVRYGNHFIFLHTVHIFWCSSFIIFIKWLQLLILSSDVIKEITFLGIVHYFTHITSGLKKKHTKKALQIHCKNILCQCIYFIIYAMSNIKYKTNTILQNNFWNLHDTLFIRFAQKSHLHNTWCTSCRKYIKKLRCIFY